MGRKAPRKRLAYRVISAFTRVFDAHDTPNGCRCTRTSLGAPPTPSIRVSEAKLQSPGAKNAPRERDRLFDIVKTECSERLSDEPQLGPRTPVLILRDASQRALAAGTAALAFRCDAPQHEGKARSTNLRLHEMSAGVASLFPACYLQ